MRIIDADAYAVNMENVLREALDKVEGKAFRDYVIASVVTGSIILDLRNDKITPTIDAVQVVRCKDCKYASYEPYKDFDNVYICNYSQWTRSEGGRFPDWYCAYGRRK